MTSIIEWWRRSSGGIAPWASMTILQHRWWSHDDLRHTDEWIWPVELVELWSLVGEPERWPVDLGTQEESTVLDTH